MRCLLDVNTKDQTLLVSVEAENRNVQEGGVLTPLVFAPSLLSIESLKSMKIWKPAVREEYRLQNESAFLPKERPLLPGVLQRCILGESGPASTSRAAAKEQDVISKLKGQGLIEGPPGKLTEAGKGAVIVGHRLSSFVPVFEAATFPLTRPIDPSVSRYQLMLRLEGEGFVHHLVDLEGVRIAKWKPYQHGLAENGEPRLKKFGARDAKLMQMPLL